MEIQQANRVLSRLMKKNTWGAKMKLRYLFNVDCDNDPAEGSNNEPPHNCTFE